MKNAENLLQRNKLVPEFINEKEALRELGVRFDPKDSGNPSVYLTIDFRHWMKVNSVEKKALFGNFLTDVAPDAVSVMEMIRLAQSRGIPCLIVEREFYDKASESKGFRASKKQSLETMQASFATAEMLVNLIEKVGAEESKKVFNRIVRYSGKPAEEVISELQRNRIPVLKFLDKRNLLDATRSIGRTVRAFSLAIRLKKSLDADAS